MERSFDTLRDRFEGCLLAGAAGDALGYAIEFWSEGEIFHRFGEDGIQTLAQAAEAVHENVAHFSDDTQMTLFTANGLTYGMERTDTGLYGGSRNRRCHAEQYEKECVCIWPFAGWWTNAVCLCGKWYNEGAWIWL